MNSKTIKKRDAINKISEVLTESDGEWISQIASKVLSAQCAAQQNVDGDDEISITKHGITEIKKADDVISEIEESLIEADIEFVNNIFISVCTQKVKIIP